MSRRRRDDWSPYAAPHLREQMAQAEQASAERLASILARSRLAGWEEEVEQKRRDAAAVAWSLRRSDLWWVSGTMADAALDAASDMPGVVADAAPAPHGIILCERPLPAYDTSQVGGVRLRDPVTFDVHEVDHLDPISVDGVHWMPLPGGGGSAMVVSLLTRTKRLPGVVFPHSTPLSSFMQVTMPLPADFSHDMTFLGPDGVSPSSESLGVVSWLAAAWHLMGLPRVAQVRALNPFTGAVSSAPRPDDLTRPLVRLVDARPLARRPAPEVSTDGEGSGRVYRHQWVVRGHWRHQAVGQGRETRRLTWVESYLKGPEGAPLVGAEKVRVWRK